MKSHFRSRFWTIETRCLNKSLAQGTTLIELLVAASITTVVMTVMFLGIITAMNANKMAEAKTRRNIDLNRAFDYISHEIRHASRINQTVSVAAEGSITVEDVVASSEVTLSSLGSYGTIVLYLEVPISSSIPTICPGGGPNAGLPPPSPTTYDPVIYDIRPTPKGWIGPRSIHRYGRIPQINGTINPCSPPVSSDILVDAIADNLTTSPTCSSPGVLAGTEGFHACVDGAQVNLFMETIVAGVETRTIASTSTSRIPNAQPTPVLSGTRQSGTDTIDFSWTWAGISNGITFQLSETIEGGAPVVIYTSNMVNTSVPLSGTIGQEHCFTVIANIEGYTSPASNQVCETK